MGKRFGNNIVPREVLHPQGASGLAIKHLCCWLIMLLTLCNLSNGASAATITFGGNITQSTQDGTGPAVNNGSLNNIQDLQSYTVTLFFPGSILAPGMFDLTGSSLTFAVPAASASESGFNSIKLTITQDAGFEEFSLLACLTTGSGCTSGNQLDANFRIPSALLNSQNVAAIGLDQPHPLDLLEDDGTTDIQGSITTYSYTTSAAVPEPSSAALLGFALAGLLAVCLVLPTLLTTGVRSVWLHNRLGGDLAFWSSSPTCPSVVVENTGYVSGHAGCAEANNVN